MAKRTPAPGEFQYPADDEHIYSFLISALKADEAIGTHHMVAGGLGDRVEAILESYEITGQMLSRLAKRLPDEPGCVDVWLPDGKIPAQYSTVAVAAMERAVQRPSLDSDPERRTRRDLLVAFLEDPDCGAAQLLRMAGVHDLSELRQAVVDDRVPVREDTCPPALRSTRDAFLGRRRYQETGARGIMKFLRKIALRMPVDYGSDPAFWARIEARDRAAVHGGNLRSDDLLLAILTTHEVGQRFPQLIEEARYGGGRRLVAAGLNSEKALAVMAEHDLGDDAVTPDEIFAQRPANSTDELLNGLLGVPDNRSARLLAQAGIDASSLGR